jgi:hypothetical protein
MSATGQNDNNDTQRLDTGTVRLDNSHDTQRIDNDTQRIDNDTVRLGGSAPGGGVLSGMGNMAGNMPQQNIIEKDASNNTGESFSPGQVIEINSKNCTIEKFNKNFDNVPSGEAVIYKVKMDGKLAVLNYQVVRFRSSKQSGL